MNLKKKKIKILFLCTGNSCRSQMAEGWTRYLKSNTIEPYSAGIEIHGLNANAVKAMAEAGIDISQHKSKNLEYLEDIDFDYVVTLCGHAHETCPVFPRNAVIIHKGFDDPPKLADENKGEEELFYYRKVRDEIRDYIETIPESFKDGYSLLTGC